LFYLYEIARKYPREKKYSTSFYDSVDQLVNLLYERTGSSTVLTHLYSTVFFRADWRSALEFPVGVVPAGSGNALNTSLLRAQVWIAAATIVM
jgi:hypothetical protein